MILLIFQMSKNYQDNIMQDIIQMEVLLYLIMAI